MTFRTYQRRGLLAGVLLGAMLASACSAEPGSGFSPGEVWSLNDARYPEAKVVIGRVEPWRDTRAVHVSVLDVRMEPEGGRTQLTSILHMPFTEDVVRASLKERLDVQVQYREGFEEGYANWRQAEGAGVYTSPIGSVVASNMKSLAAIRRGETRR